MAYFYMRMRNRNWQGGGVQLRSRACFFFWFQFLVYQNNTRDCDFSFPGIVDFREINFQRSCTCFLGIFEVSVSQFMMNNEHLACKKCNLIFLSSSSLQKHMSKFCKFTNFGENKKEEQLSPYQPYQPRARRENFTHRFVPLTLEPDLLEKVFAKVTKNNNISVRNFARKCVKIKSWKHQKSWWFLPLIALLTASFLMKVEQIILFKGFLCLNFFEKKHVLENGLSDFSFQTFYIRFEIPLETLTLNSGIQLRTNNTRNSQVFKSNFHFHKLH